MTNEQLSASLSYLGDELLAECGARRQRPKRSWRTALIKAACIALVLFSGIYVAGRFDYSLGAGCASSPGTIADGRYYYHVRHSGVWCYDPAMGTSERVLSTFWYDGYAVNGYGIYYLRGETLYVQVHETGERIKLYTAPQDCTRLFFSLLGGGRISYYLARQMLDFGASVKIIESSAAVRRSASAPLTRLPRTRPPPSISSKS